MTTLLLVEDDPAIYDTIAPYVKREGWELRWARSVTESRRAIDELRPDAALVIGHGLARFARGLVRSTHPAGWPRPS